jgi:hypothetical protein
MRKCCYIAIFLLTVFTEIHLMCYLDGVFVFIYVYLRVPTF